MRTYKIPFCELHITHSLLLSTQNPYVIRDNSLKRKIISHSHKNDNCIVLIQYNLRHFDKVIETYIRKYFTSNCRIWMINTPTLRK